ncbi:MAG: Nif3-like dinuclear metal center hexameric protein, partial [Bacillota bacterium]|nr:Nif3-like dinuclear metal center hexameric protein [Bacillota bacterium]
IAPKRLAADWDNVGLQLGSFNNDITKVLLTIDINQQVIAEAIEADAQLIITHHPLIFQPLKQLRSDLPQGNLIYNLINGGINVYAAHTNWDSTRDGVSQTLANLLELANCEVLKVTSTEQLYKIVVFVPHGHEDKVRDGLSKGGAGYIGNYSSCTYQTDGIGTFKPEEGTNPFIGQQGLLEKVTESRIETIVPEEKLNSAIKAMLKAHPYEEVAYDIIPLHNKGQAYGLGVYGTLAYKVPLKQLLERTKAALGISFVRVLGDLDREVKSIAVCGGSGGDLVSAAQFKGADVLITGDVSYHQALTAEAIGLALIDAGHYPTEILSMRDLASQLTGKATAEKRTVQFVMSKINTDPWRFF